MPDIAPPHDLDELLEINRTLAALIAPLQALLAMEQAPGIDDRLNSMIADLAAIRDQVHRAADLMDATLTRNAEDRAAEAQMAQQIATMQQDIAQLRAWFSAPPGAAPS